MRRRPSQPGRRISFGGAVVESSLRQAGYETAGSETAGAGVALVETARPARAPYRAVLAQNAWNFVPDEEFRRLVGRYPPRMQSRIRARRLLAGVNGRRADRVVCLTEYMAELCSASLRRPTVCMPVSLPLGLDRVTPVRPAAASPDGGFVLVAGTITWYKQPWIGVELAARLAAELGRPVDVVLAGTDDGSGCRQRCVEATGISTSGHRTSRLTVSTYPTPELQWLYDRSLATVLPSDLESLGFGLAEALLAARRPAAAPIRPHREVAARLGREPVWLATDLGVTAVELLEAQPCRARPDWLAARRQWLAVGEALGLVPRIRAVDAESQRNPGSLSTVSPGPPRTA